MAPSRSEGVTRNPEQEALADTDMQEAVARALRKDSLVPSDDIQVRVVAGVVELSGQVPHLLALERAVSVADSVEGVRSVSARVSVAPSDRADAAIQRDIERALRLDPAVEESKIQILVAQRAATLRGTVDSWREREAAGRHSKSVRGVRVVANHLTIRGEVMPSDDDIRADARERLFWDALVDDRLLVTTSEDHGSNSGVNRSAAERRSARTHALAW